MQSLLVTLMSSDNFSASQQTLDHSHIIQYSYADFGNPSAPGAAAELFNK